MTSPTPQRQGPTTKQLAVTGGILCAAVGWTCAAIVTPFVSMQESGGRQHLQAYADIVGMWTVCDGDTQGVTKDTLETPAGCAIRLDRRLADFAKPVLMCAPVLKDHPYQLAASISLAYNVGATAFCGSTVAERFNAHQWAGACNAILLWDKAGGQVVQGIVNRRNAERKLCLTKVPA